MFESTVKLLLSHQNGTRSYIFGKKENHKLTSHSSAEVKRALVTLAIEKALLDTGGNKLLYDISMELFVNHKSYIQDCFEHPEHLRKTLNGFEIRGKIIETIKNNLEEFSYEKPITEFLTKLTTT